MTPTLSEPLVAAMRGPTNYTDRGEIQRMVEEALAGLKLPGDFVRAGDRVVLKPNWVKEHDERTPGPDREPLRTRFSWSEGGDS